MTQCAHSSVSPPGVDMCCASPRHRRTSAWPGPPGGFLFLPWCVPHVPSCKPAAQKHVLSLCYCKIKEEKRCSRRADRKEGSDKYIRWVGENRDRREEGAQRQVTLQAWELSWCGSPVKKENCASGSQFLRVHILCPLRITLWKNKASHAE